MMTHSAVRFVILSLVLLPVFTMLARWLSDFLCFYRPLPCILIVFCVLASLMLF